LLTNRKSVDVHCGRAVGYQVSPPVSLRLYEAGKGLGEVIGWRVKLLVVQRKPLQDGAVAVVFDSLAHHSPTL
jgi:hypothetical protein